MVARAKTACFAKGASNPRMISICILVQKMSIVMSVSIAMNAIPYFILRIVPTAATVIFALPVSGAKTVSDVPISPVRSIVFLTKNWINLSTSHGSKNSVSPTKIIRLYWLVFKNFTARILSDATTM